MMMRICKVELFAAGFLSIASCGLQDGNTAQLKSGAESGTQTSMLRSDSADGFTLFPTVGYEEVVEAEIAFPSIDVCPLFEPSERKLIYDWWDPTILREQEGDTLEGQLMVTSVSNIDVYLLVTKHEPESGRLQYLVLWGDFELQRIGISCTKGERVGTTKIVWTERNAGLHEKGVSLVSAFVENGSLENAVKRYVTNVTQHLERNAD